MSSYVVWANKGGIGKSTLTFQMACAAAISNPEKLVYVLDLSPQCDVSRMILGGGHHRGEERILSLMGNAPRRTVYGYLTACLNDVISGNGWPDPFAYIVEPNNVRCLPLQPTAAMGANAPSLPPNLRLMCGDFDLERAIQRLEQVNQPPQRGGRAPTGPHYSAYLLARSFLRYAVEQIEATNDSIVVIDTDPYFNVITTQMALIAADNWIAAYSPNSQASQFSITRSIEFMFEPVSGLSETVRAESTRYGQDWYDNRDQIISKPQFSVADPYLLIANMTTPRTTRGGTVPQQLHSRTIAAVNANVQTSTGNFGVQNFHHHIAMWNMHRLGLICDYNGIELMSLRLGGSYHQPASNRPYKLPTTGGTPSQLQRYVQQLERVVATVCF